MDVGICYKILKFSTIVPTASHLSVVFCALLVAEYVSSGETGEVVLLKSLPLKCRRTEDPGKVN